MDLAATQARLLDLERRNQAVLARSKETLVRARDLMRETERLLDRRYREAAGLAEDEGCPQHPRAGPGLLGAEAIEARGRTIVTPCMRCRVCGEAYLTAAQADALEREMARLE